MKTAVSSFSRLSLIRAFTLMEVLLTSAVVSSGALVVMGVLASGLNSSRAGLQGAQSSIIARGVMQDLRLGGLRESPASGDKRLTSVLRPSTGLDFSRQVLLLDAAGLPLVKQLSIAQAETLYRGGAHDPEAVWLVSIEGSTPASSLSSGGQGQVQASVNVHSYSALEWNSSSASLKSSVTLPSDPAPMLAPTQVTILVESPAAAPEGARLRYRFVELWNR